MRIQVFTWSTAVIEINGISTLSTEDSSANASRCHTKVNPCVITSSSMCYFSFTINQEAFCKISQIKNIQLNRNVLILVN